MWDLNKAGWIKFVSVNPNMKIVDLQKELKSIQEEEDEPGTIIRGMLITVTDPHIWMSVHNARIIATQHSSGTARCYFPVKRTTCRQSYDEFSLVLGFTCTGQLLAKLEDIENRKFMIYHPALTYFARDYDLEQYPLGN